MITQKTSYPYKGIYSILYMIFAPQMLRTTTLNNVMSWKQRDYYMSQPTFNSILRSSVAIFLKLTCGFLLIHSAGLPSAEAQSWIHSCEDALIRYQAAIPFWTEVTKGGTVYVIYTSHGPTNQGKNIVVNAAKYSLENLEGGIITLICRQNSQSKLR